VPTHERTRRFERDWGSLTIDERRRFRVAFEKIDADLAARRFRPGLRVKPIEGAEGVFEMTWAPDGRATFEYGPPEGTDARLIWRRIGTHDVFRRP
jgi:hypothetical protein